MSSKIWKLIVFVEIRFIVKPDVQHQKNMIEIELESICKIITSIFKLQSEVISGPIYVNLK